MTSESPLSPSRLELLGKVLNESGSTDPEQRAAFIRSQFNDDPELMKEALSLVKALDESEGYFETLAEVLVTPAMLAAAFDREQEVVPVGARISHYEILGKAGRGGMGIVYKARDVHLTRTVALKFLPPRHASNPLARARLLAEAQAASALDHPNIGTVYEIGETDAGRSFIALAWYDGETLKDKIRRAPIPIHEAVDIALQLGTGLSAAHAAGVIHRDVKPANVVITRSGVAKLVDFGIAKFTTADTTDGSTVGTPAYMSPEQTFGDAVDARTDIWSLGVLMYEMLTGFRPFEGESEPALIESIRTGQHPAASLRRSEIPASLSAIVEKCLASEPASRYSTAAEFCDALRNWSLKPVSRRSAIRQYQGPLVALLVVVVIGLAAGAREIVMKGQRALGGSNPTGVQHTIAVLPFIAGGADRADGHVANGFTDGVIETLGRADNMKVLAKTSAAALLREGIDPLEAGRRLAAEAIVRGEFRRAADRYIVNASLVSTANGRVLWARQFDRPATDAFVVQNEISQQVTRALIPGGSSARNATSRRPPTRDLEAYELFLKGRFAWDQRTREKLEAALAYFRGALERDPDFAAAHSAMSVAYINMSNFGYMPNDEALTRAELAADRAIAIDSTLVDAHAARGFVLASRGAYRESESEFKKGIEINPNFSWTYHYYALLLMGLGRIDDATDNLRASLALDPLSLPANATLGILNAMKERKIEARQQFERTVALSPEFQLTLYYFGTFAAAEGRNAEAVRMLEKALALSPGFPGVRASLAVVYRRLGRTNDALRLERALAAAVSDERSRINLALGYAALNKHDTAFAMLKDARWDVPTLIEMRANPLLADFRSDPRYSQLVREIEKGR